MTKAILVELSAHDTAILQAINTLNMMEAKIEPLIRLHGILVESVKGITFGSVEGNGRHEIKLDDEHSIVVLMEDGKFSYEQVCNCEDHHEEKKEG